MSIKKRSNVIQEVIEALESGQLIPSSHAQEQMQKRDIQMSDIEEMIYRARREEAKDSLTNDKKDWKYALRGLNDKGDKDLRIIVVFADPKTIIVTAIDKNKKED
ncbi:DUF4258 domain-containing protein [Bdellovibrio bacteriovorus]|uniref:DUF4258 domain-containing protein n=1 Tax=Bdellovibrio TaxID=958 RepID=UPI0035A91B3B